MYNYGMDNQRKFTLTSRSILIVVVGFSLLFVFVKRLLPGDTKDLNSVSNVERVYGVALSDDSLIAVEMADSHFERLKGLSGRSSLDKDSGMLFIYDTPTHATYWMRNTYISLDIIFMNEDFVVMYVVDSAQPCSEDPCPSYGPDTAIDNVSYVLEVNGGRTSDIVRVGDILKPVNFEL